MQLRLKFDKWCRSDPERAKRLENLYNYQCNNLRLRTYDGSHMSFDNMSSAWVKRIKGRPYQANGIYRGVTGQTLDDALCGLGVYWQVGLGKTVCGTAIAAERVLNQTAQRALIVVKKQTMTTLELLEIHAVHCSRATH